MISTTLIDVKTNSKGSPKQSQLRHAPMADADFALLGWKQKKRRAEKMCLIAAGKPCFGRASGAREKRL